MRADLFRSRGGFISDFFWCFLWLERALRCLSVHCLLTIIYFINAPLIEMAAREKSGCKWTRVITDARYYGCALLWMRVIDARRTGEEGHSPRDDARTCHLALTEDASRRLLPPPPGTRLVIHPKRPPPRRVSACARRTYRRAL